MKIKIQFHTNNAAFDIDPADELEYIFKRCQEIIFTEDSLFQYPIYDSNGNNIGFVEAECDEE